MSMHSLHTHMPETSRISRASKSKMPSLEVIEDISGWRLGGQRFRTHKESSSGGSTRLIQSSRGNRSSARSLLCRAWVELVFIQTRPVYTFYTANATLRNSV